MKSRYAAAFLIAGWYLTVPPVVSGGGPIYADRSVRLAEWTINSAYGTAQSCEAVKAPEIDAAKRKGEAEAYTLERS